jgi:hypothetical protein
VITVDDYFMGRRDTHSLAMSPSIERNATRTVNTVNALLALSGLHVPLHPTTRTPVSSGWRPPTVNASTPNAATNSKHMTGEAVDLYDPDGDLDEWLLTDDGQAALKRVGLWMEHPASTRGWSHLQIVPPRSGRRVFYP